MSLSFMLNAGVGRGKLPRCSGLRPTRGRFPSQGKTLFAPTANPAIHRKHFGVAHLLQVVGSHGRAKAAAAVENQRSVEVRNTPLNISLDYALAEVNRAGKVVFSEFALFPHIHQREFFAAIEFLFHFVDADLFNTRLGVVHNFQKARSMPHGPSWSKSGC